MSFQRLKLFTYKLLRNQRDIGVEMKAMKENLSLLATCHTSCPHTTNITFRTQQNLLDVHQRATEHRMLRDPFIGSLKVPKKKKKHFSPAEKVTFFKKSGKTMNHQKSIQFHVCTFLLLRSKMHFTSKR